MARLQSGSPISALSSIPSAVTVAYLHSISPILDHYQPTGPEDDTILLLEKTYQHLPRDGQQAFGSDIEDCRTSRELCQLAQHIDTALLRPMMATGGKTVPVTHLPS